MYKIGVDISLRSTAICTNDNGDLKFFSFIKKDIENKWLKKLDFVNIIPITYVTNSKDYSESEIQKLDAYSECTNSIITALINNLPDKSPDIIQIEGYSQGQQAGRLIDLVTLSVLLRIKLRLLWPNAHMDIVAPRAMKKQAGLLTYEVGADGRSRNSMGKASGSFDKLDLLECMINYKKDSQLKKWIIDEYDTILKMKKIPSPIDDIVDSYFLQEIILDINK